MGPDRHDPIGYEQALLVHGLRHVSEARARLVAAADVADAATAAAGSTTAATDAGDAAAAAAGSTTASGPAGDAAASAARSTTASGATGDAAASAARPATTAGATGTWGCGRRDAGRSSGRGGGCCCAAGCLIAASAAANRQNEHGSTAENRNRRSSFRSHQTPHSRDSAATSLLRTRLGALQTALSATAARFEWRRACRWPISRWRWAIDEQANCVRCPSSRVPRRSR
jgi:hypothetical protein